MSKGLAAFFKPPLCVGLLPLLIAITSSCQGKQMNAIQAYKQGKFKPTTSASPTAQPQYFQPIAKPVPVRNSPLMGLSFKEVLALENISGMSPYGNTPDKFCFNDRTVSPTDTENVYISRMHILKFQHGAVVSHEMTERLMRIP